MKLVLLVGANNAPVWINPDAISFLRPTVDGEAGNTMIMFEGQWLTVDDTLDEVRAALAVTPS